MAFARAVDASRPQGVELEVCALKALGGNPLEEELRRHGVPVKVVGSRGLRDTAAFRRLLARLRRDPPDLLHAHLTDATIWGAALARRLGRPCVATLHVLPETRAVPGWRGALRRRAELRALRRTDAVLAVSAAVRDAWVDAGLPAERVEVVHNGVDTLAFAHAAADAAGRAAARARLGVPPGEALLATVTVLRAGKGVDTLLAAFELLQTTRTEARLLIVGDGPEAERLRRRADPLAGVHWAGYQARVEPWLAAADVFVLPSRDDAFPTVLLEAAAAGLPAVAAASGGVPEIVVDGETGVLVAPDRPEELAAAIAELLADPARRWTMGEAARRRAHERFSLAAWRGRLERVYRRLTAVEGDGAAAGGAERPLRIAVVEPAARGGMIHYAHQLCRGLAEAGAEPTLVTALADELASLPHSYRRLELLRLWDPKPAAGGRSGPPRRAARAVVWYREWLRLIVWVARERPDAVQFGDVRFAGDLLPLLALSLVGPPLVDVCHNVRPFAGGGRRAGWFASGRPTRWLYRRIYRRFDRVAVHFAANRAAFLAETGLPPRRVATIVHGNQEIFRELADPAVTPATLRRRLGLPEAAPVVLLFGSLAPYKGVDLAIEALARIGGRAPEARLVVAGFPLPGFDLAAHRRLAERHAVVERVVFVPGYVPSGEVAAWMALAALVVLPYRQIFQSGVLPVAQTFGRPVVAAAVGALPEAIDDGRTGLLVPPEDPAALAGALAALLADPVRAERLGEAAAADARDRFAWRRVAEDLLAVHRQAIAERGRRR